MLSDEFHQLEGRIRHSCRLSYLSNQNDWQPVHRSIVTDRPMWASSVMEVIFVLQAGQFMSMSASLVANSGRGKHILLLFKEKWLLASKR